MTTPCSQLCTRTIAAHMARLSSPRASRSPRATSESPFALYAHYSFEEELPIGRGPPVWLAASALMALLLMPMLMPLVAQPLTPLVYRLEKSLAGGKGAKQQLMLLFYGQQQEGVVIVQQQQQPSLQVRTLGSCGFRCTQCILAVSYAPAGHLLWPCTACARNGS